MFLFAFSSVNICVSEGWGVRAHVLVAKVRKNLLTFYSSPAMTRFLFRFKPTAFSVFVFSAGMVNSSTIHTCKIKVAQEERKSPLDCG